jgi:hypothetical protein
MRAMTRVEAEVREQHAHAFLVAAELVAELGQDAVKSLKQAVPGKNYAAQLRRLVDSKSESQYSALLITEARAAELMVSARKLVDGADEVLRTLS